MKNAIYASFTNVEDAEKATGALMDFGLRAEDISLIAPEHHGDRAKLYTGTHPMEGQTYGDSSINSSVNDTNKDDMKAKTGITTTTGADAVAGAEVGAGVGLGVGVAAALAALLVPGFGLVVGGGALAMAIAGAAATTGAGALAGGALGFMKDQGVPAHVVESYNTAFQSGSTILAISSTSDIDHSAINQILTKYNGTNIRESEYAGTR